MEKSVGQVAETTASPWQEDPHTSLADEILFFYKLLICFFGLFGNVTNVVVIQFTKVPLTMRVTISVLALSDLCYIAAFSPAVVFPKISKISFLDYSNITCQLSTFSGLFFSFVSGLMVAVLTVERIVAVMFPLHANLLLSVKRLIVGTSLFILAHFGASAYFASQFVVEDFYDDNNTLLYSSCFNDELHNELEYFGVLLNMVTPLTVIVLGNIIIMIIVIIKKKQISGIISGRSHQGGEIRLVITTVSISVSSIILTSPLAFYYTLGEAILDHEVFVDWTNPLFLTCDALYYTNFAVNFFLYMAFTSSFRNVFQVFVRECAVRRRSTPIEERSGTNDSVLPTVTTGVTQTQPSFN